MIRHVFMWQTTESASNADVLGLLTRLSEELTMIRTWEVAGHVGEPNENGDPWDGVLITDFETWEDLEAYSTHPVHEEIVAQLLPQVRSRAVVDFVRETDVS